MSLFFFPFLGGSLGDYHFPMQLVSGFSYQDVEISVLWVAHHKHPFVVGLSVQQDASLQGEQWTSKNVPEGFGIACLIYWEHSERK